MGCEINLMGLFPQSKKSVDERASLITDEHRRVAREFGHEYFDGSRLQGYGGYYYHPRFWTDVVRRFRDYYKLAGDTRILDVGCAKGFMLYDFKQLIPSLTVAGIDISKYAIEHAIPSVSPFLEVGTAESLPYEDSSFDLVISLDTIHNLDRRGCERALREIMRVTKKDAFIRVDAWRTDEERERFMKWNLTALTYMSVDDWKGFFKEAGYTGDYYWTIT